MPSRVDCCVRRGYGAGYFATVRVLRGSCEAEQRVPLLFLEKEERQSTKSAFRAVYILLEAHPQAPWVGFAEVVCRIVS